MAYIQKTISKKTGEVLNWKWTAFLGRDAEGKQVRKAKRVEPFSDMTPGAERKKMQRLADEWEEQEKIEYQKIRDREDTDKALVRKEKDRITLSDFIDKRWMPNHVKKGVKPHTPDTIAFYTSMSEDIKAYFKDKIKLSQLDKEDVLSYISYMNNDAKTKKGDPYSSTTVQHHFSTLRNILEYAVYTEYIKENPCKKIRPDDRPKRNHKEISFLDVDESIRFITCLDSPKEVEYWEKHNHSHLFWKTLVNVLITTGLRRGELVGLQWGDIDRKKMLINVQRNVTIDTSNKEDTDSKSKIHIGQLKGRDKDESRKVPISKYILDLFDQFKTEQVKKYESLLMPDAYIFCREDDPTLPIYPTEPTRMLKKYNERHKLPNMSPHDLRHTAGYLAIESGATVKQIQALLGHKDPALSLKFYIGITEQNKQETVEGIESLLRPKADKAEEKRA